MNEIIAQFYCYLQMCSQGSVNKKIHAFYFTLKPHNLLVK